MSETSPTKGTKGSKLGKRKLAELRAELESDREALRAQVTRLEAEFAEESQTRPSSDDEVDTGSATSERERTMSLARHARGQLALIEEALERVEAGTYGVCVTCGQGIDPDRLEARPQSVQCMTCQRASERGR
jgi:DnaK suppressor protein